MRIMLPAVTAGVAVAVVACQPSGTAPAGTQSNDEAVVSATSFSRSGTRETHYAECVSPAGAFRVQVPADLAYALQEGQPCPDGPREPMPADQYPELYEELQKTLPYGGGDIHTCGEWQTVDKEEARRMAEQCPPLKWGDLS